MKKKSRFTYVCIKKFSSCRCAFSKKIFRQRRNFSGWRNFRAGGICEATRHNSTRNYASFFICLSVLIVILVVFLCSLVLSSWRNEGFSRSYCCNQYDRLGIWHCILSVCLSVCPSVHLSVELCIVAKRYILQQSVWTTQKHDFTTFNPVHRAHPPNSLAPTSRTIDVGAICLTH